MSLESAIRTTVNYAKKYGCSLTWEECRERLIGSKNYELRITHHGGQANYEFKKQNNNKYFEKKLKLAKDLVINHLSKFDDIIMVGATGSVASKYPKRNDDIDLLIITKANCLWTTRLKLKLYLMKNGIKHRKFEEKHENNKFCFNMWLDDSALKIPPIKRILKNAVDLVLMIPLLDRNNSYQKFLNKNSWAKEYVATPYLKKITNYELPTTAGRRITNNKFSLLNWIAYWGQYWYMKSKISNEIIDIHRAFFHPKG